MILQTHVVGALGTNCYLVASEATREAMIIDPGGDAPEILGAVEAGAFQARLIVLTHFHFDHVLAVEAVRAKTGASLAIHRNEAEHLTKPPPLFRFFSPPAPRGLVADRLLDDGQHLSLGELDIEVLFTPGHSPGGISLYVASEGVVFTGDALFREGVGRTDFAGCDADLLRRSIRERLFALPEATAVYPGHGPATTIGHERSHNPWAGGR